jgi:hypothetical protein
LGLQPIAAVHHEAGNRVASLGGGDALFGDQAGTGTRLGGAFDDYRRSDIGRVPERCER